MKSWWKFISPFRELSRVSQIIVLVFVLTVPITGAKAQEEEKKIEHRGICYRVVEAKAAQIRIVWKDGEGKPLKQIPKAAEYLESKGEKPLMIMNGGIYEPGFVPSGLMIEAGKELNAVNRRDGREFLPQAEWGLSRSRWEGRGCGYGRLPNVDGRYLRSAIRAIAFEEREDASGL